MPHTSYFEMLCNDSPNPCYFVDINSYEILYLNKAMSKLLKNANQYDGLPCYQVIHEKTSPCEFCPNGKSVPLDFFESTIFHQSTQNSFRVNSTLLDMGGVTVNMSKFFLANQAQSSNALTFEEAMSHCGRILNHESADDSTYIVSACLALLGEFYCSEKSYIFQIKDDIATTSHYWLKEQPNVTYSQCQQTEALSRLVLWLKENEGLSVVEINTDINQYQPDSLEAQLLLAYDITNLAICPLRAPNKELIGFVGVSNRQTGHFDYRLLKAIARIMGESFSVHSMRQELNKLSDLDPLTGFFNRNRYADYLKDLQTTPPDSLGVLFINLNGLRKTNEYFGYEVGDIQIMKAVNQLKLHFMEDFYRISGDEFICFLPNCQQDTFDKRVKKLQDELKDTCNNAFSVGSSWDKGSYDLIQLVGLADTVMYINKQEYYFNSMKENQELTESILQDLLSAIKNQEFLVYLQPKVQLSTGIVSGAEALVRRFDEKNQKMIYPDNFIPLYEKNSIIRHVDLYVLDKVCQILALWGDDCPRVPISVNLSRITLTEYDIVETVTGICDQYSIPRSLIMLEVTERVGLKENEVSSTLVEAFQAQGFKISLDDFGCAYSNIVTLAQISVDEVKIDKSLVDNLEINPKNKIILENVINMCNSLENTTTLAEGIEEEIQADSLRAINCDYGQGYLYSKPIPHEEFYKLFILNETLVGL